MRLIDAEKLANKTCAGGTCSNCDDYWKGNNVRTNCSEIRFYILKLIGDQPTVDAVPVIRCKECKWSDEEGRCEVHETLSGNDFCSKGERREE